MNQEKTGQLIATLRKEKGMTQKELADKMNLSDKAVSKWERGAGCPDISYLAELSEILGASIDSLISGNLDENEASGGNMKNLKFYYCDNCKNIITATGDTAASCCGKKLTKLELKNATDKEKLKVEKIENDYYITTEHEMTKEHYISFIAFINGDTMIIKRQYPEWNLQVRIPCMGHGRLVWYCVKHGLFYSLI